MIINTYIAKQIIPPCLLVAGVILGLDFVLLLSEEANLITRDGQGLSVFLSILYTEPHRLYEAMPMILLLGTLIGLGGMANNNELNVLRAAGVSLRRLAGGVLLALTPLIVFNIVLGEYVVPKAQQQSSILQATFEAKSPAKGFWLKEGESYVQVGGAVDDRLQDISIYTYQNSQWQSTLWAEQAYYDGNQWVLVNGYEIQKSITSMVKESPIQKTAIQAQTDQIKITQTPFDERFWPIELTLDLVSQMGNEPEYLSVQDLYSQANYLQKVGINGDLFILSFWKKLFQPLFMLALVLVAMSFVFGSQRSVPVGQRILWGTFIGLGFNYSLDIFGPISSLFNFPTPLAYGLPIMICLLLAWRLFKRVN